ncbi:calcium-binding protein [Paracoccus sp. ME4]|uniref:calcium-binding protein n=1 Tax=Paracoccus sp. ME4 TaxID=3138066 RepID=UPI00398AF4C0
MAFITKEHFGGNVILTRDNLKDGSPYAETLKEIDFHNIRFPGGGITEAQTWENGGLQKMFGDPMDPEEPGYVLTLREMLSYAAESGQTISIVIPTFQFFDSSTDYFDTRGFKAYITELQKALSEYPDAQISSFEIGNEYWGSKEWGGLEPDDYGRIANSEIPLIKEMIDAVWPGSEDQPAIGVQAGVQWKAEQNADGTWTAVGSSHSAQIINSISIENRGHIDAVFQHSYPDAEKIEQCVNWAIRPMDVFSTAEGFPDELKFILSEFNVGKNTAVGVQQGAAWIDAFSKFVDAGITNIDHWGVSYEWLSNKFYDTQFPSAESDNGSISAIATPMGQLYDIAERHLIGSEVVSDTEAMTWASQSSHFDVTGFEKPGQTISFYYNSSDPDGKIYLSEISSEYHVSTFHIVAADSPYSDWYDESISTPLPDGKIADARGDMKVVSGVGGESDYNIGRNEIVVVVISDKDRDLFIEGAHNVTDPRTGLVDDVIQGARGNDVLLGHIGDDRIYGHEGKNILSGGKGADILIAGNRGDVIFSDGGNDTVKGGVGDDVVLFSSSAGHLISRVSGSEGRDFFVFTDNVSVTIADFSEDDYLSFGGVFRSKSALEDAMVIENNDIVIALSEGGSVNLKNSAHLYHRILDTVVDFKSPAAQSSFLLNYLKGMSDFQITEVFARSQEVQDYSIWGLEYLEKALRSVGGLGSDLDDDFVIYPGSKKNVAGTDRQDKIFGNHLDNVIKAKGGADIVYSRDGNDVVHGGTGDDSLLGGVGNDTLFGGFDNDKLIGGTGNDRVFGGSGNDKLSGEHGHDYLSGGYGTDYIDGGGGADTLDGGFGDDKLFGSFGNDHILGGLGSDWLNGGSGNDTLDGGAGADWVSFQGMRHSVRIDVSVAGSQATGYGRDVILNVENIHGGAGNDTLLGNSQSNIIRGGMGADRILGRQGNDQLEGNQGADIIDGGIGNDTLLGGLGNDRIFGGQGNDWLNGGFGNDTLNGGAGADWISFQEGRHSARIDLAVTGSQATGYGRDVILNVENIYGGSGSDTFLGNAQSNVIKGGMGADRIFGRQGNDRIEGNQGADVINGGAGNDSLYGGLGDDHLFGGIGDDRLCGGAGNDVFVFKRGFDRDVIFDFQDDIDAIWIKDLGIVNYDQAISLATQDGEDVVFDFGNGDVLTVRNATVAAIVDDLLFT